MVKVGEHITIDFLGVKKDYTPEFEMGIGVWIYSMYQSKPQSLNGKQYWVATPPFRKKKDFGDVPVGMDDDTKYL